MNAQCTNLPLNHSCSKFKHNKNRIFCISLSMCDGSESFTFNQAWLLYISVYRTAIFYWYLVFIQVQKNSEPSSCSLTAEQRQLSGPSQKSSSAVWPRQPHSQSPCALLVRRSGGSQCYTRVVSDRPCYTFQQETPR